MCIEFSTMFYKVHMEQVLGNNIASDSVLLKVDICFCLAVCRRLIIVNGTGANTCCGCCYSGHCLCNDNHILNINPSREMFTEFHIARSLLPFVFPRGVVSPSWSVRYLSWLISQSEPDFSFFSRGSCDPSSLFSTWVPVSYLGYKRTSTEQHI